MWSVYLLDMKTETAVVTGSFVSTEECGFDSALLTLSGTDVRVVSGDSAGFASCSTDGLQCLNTEANAKAARMVSWMRSFEVTQ